MMNRVIIGVGSNIDAYRNIGAAQKILEKEQVFISSSPLLRTKPVGNADQPDFVNCAFLIETPLGRDKLRTYLKKTEERLGRIRTGNKYGPRTIDLDIAVWNGTIVDTDYYTRDFLQQSVDFFGEKLQ
ncbi:MAG: 2-amino-4-hydroxy-6-hydroxymethyldihydropteridine diphosphokinase [Chitinivibrionales bacterium]|nr:2-amino-4-hydroxy-6-hydroxymethyldihydropteridine diphosphokinase [Chitinivibrionales bacterium]